MSAEHVDFDTLAALDEGLVDDDTRIAALRAHVSTCDECRDRAGTLRATRALLSALPSPSMPDEVAARIDAALAEEPTPAQPTPTTVVPLTRRRAWWRHPNIAAAAAAVAAIGLGTAVVVGKVGAGKGSTGKTAQSPFAAAAGTAANGPRQWATGTDYTRSTVAALVPRLLLNAPPPSLPPEETTSQPAPKPTATGSGLALPGASVQFDQHALRDPIALATCATILNGATTRPLAADYAKYEGSPAVLIVIPDHSKPTQFVDVWVIRSVCSNSAADLTFFELPYPR